MTTLTLRRFAVLVLPLLALAPVTGEEKTPWWPAEVEQALGRAGPNRAELVKALEGAPAPQRKAMAFLVAHMPPRDLRALKADFLRENVELAFKARQEVPWGEKVPEELFLNDVLPYAHLDEARDPWRKELFELCLPLVKGCKTPAEAARKLNETIFPRLKVRYSTKRAKACQSPKESIEQGLASCTGLSILLAAACRSVAVPARVVGTPMWANERGNHTWVEVWDGRWHFTGAAEPDPNGLDRGWFAGDAAQAKKDSPRHAIYAASYRRTGLHFPLAWARGDRDVPAENVTDRYTRGAAQGAAREAEKAARAYFEAGAEKQAGWKFDARLDEQLARHEDAVRQAAWAAYRAAPVHEKAKKDFDANQVRHGEHLSPYVVRKVGTRPDRGWPLFIALHGGGGAPKAVNDSQWRVMQRYYRDQGSVSGYQYLALRAPNDTWNGFYADYVPPLVVNLIRQFLLFGDVNPDKVFLMGYSHGGYGAFFIGPKVADRFAAVHSSAAAPTDGTISPKTLRNTRFTFMIGENDNAYGRRKRCEAFDQEVQKLKRPGKPDFPVEMEFKKGHGHGGLPDRDKIKEMYPFARKPRPRHVSWELTDVVVRQFFWLEVDEPGAGKGVDARIDGNKVEVTTRKVGHFDLCLDSRLADFGKPLRVTLDGKEQTVAIRPSFLTLCRSLAERGDPELACTCKVTLKPEKR